MGADEYEAEFGEVPESDGEDVVLSVRVSPATRETRTLARAPHILAVAFGLRPFSCAFFCPNVTCDGFELSTNRQSHHSPNICFYTGLRD